MLASLSDLFPFLPSFFPSSAEKDTPVLPRSALLRRRHPPSGGGVAGLLPTLSANVRGLPPAAAEAGEALRICFPAAAWATALWFKAGNYNVQVVVGEDETEEALLRRFKREVFKAGVIQECKRRRWFEDKQAKKKRKARDAARRNRKRRFVPKISPPDKQEASKKVKEEEEDNWELPEGELPY